MAGTDGTIRLPEIGTPDTPPANNHRVYVGSDGHLKKVDDAGAIVDYDSALAFTAEDAVDAVGAALTDTSSISMTYNDGANEISSSLVPTTVVAGSYGTASNVPVISVDPDGRLTSATNTPIAITASQVTDFQEAVEDAVGPSFLDSPSVNFTYNDGSNTITADVIAGGVNHDALQNFSANEHVDHSSVQVETVLNSGLSGGGDLTATRSLALNVNNLPDFGFPENLENGLLVPVYDSNDTTHKKIQRRFLASINPDLYYAQADDFVGTVSGGLFAIASGAGASNQVGTYGIDGGENALGVSQLDTGTTALGRASLGSSAATQLFKTTSTAFKFRVRQAIELLSSPTDTFFQRNGFSNGFGSAGIGSEYLGFTYTDAQNGGRYEFISRKAAVVTQAVDTGVAADLDYKIFEIRWHKDGSADGYINGTLVGTILAANAPVNIGLSIGFSIEKTVGLTQRNLSSDWYSFEIYRDTVR